MFPHQFFVYCTLLTISTNLSFTSVIYGASQKLNITTDNANLAQKLGINGVQTTQAERSNRSTRTTFLWKTAFLGGFLALLVRFQNILPTMIFA